MIYCEKCGNKEQERDFSGKRKATIYFTEFKEFFQCHGCKNEVAKCQKQV
jgi:hypothetical protein